MLISLLEFVECNSNENQHVRIFQPPCAILQPVEPLLSHYSPVNVACIVLTFSAHFCEKCKIDAIPLAAIWNEETQEYMVGFADGVVQRYDGSLKPKRSFRLPEGIEPHILACDGETIFIADRRCPYVIALDLSGTVLGCRTLPGKIFSSPSRKTRATRSRF